MEASRFDLEKAVAAWRRSFEHRRVILCEDIDELECHLRDHVDWLRAGGLSEEEAFRVAQRKVGAHGPVEAAYRRVFWAKMKHRRSLLRAIGREASMLKHYSTMTVRTLLRHKGYALLNVVGLAVGIACFLVIFVHVRHELSYDRFHADADRIYRVQMHYGEPYNQDWAPIEWGFGDMLQAPEYRAMAAATRLRRPNRPPVVRRGDRVFVEEGVMMADSTVFEVFTFPLLRGDPATALAAPDRLVLSESMARKYFGEEDPIGQTLQVDETTMQVSAVMSDVPSASHVRFDFLVPYGGNLNPWVLSEERRWDGHTSYTYVKLRHPGARASLLEAVNRKATEAHGGEEAYQVDYYLMPVTDLHFDGRTGQELEPASNRAYVYVFSAAALFLLLIACINFMNLATARGAERAREIGMRKALGAHRRQLVTQFVGEALLLTAVSLGLALLLVELLLPLFNHVAGKSLVLDYLDPWWMPLLLGGLLFVVGVGAGAYPAFFLSTFDPLQVIKGQLGRGAGHAVLRRALVVFQFVVSTFLIISTLVMSRQLDYLQSRNLGLDQERMFVIKVQGSQVRDAYQTLKEAFLRIPAVRSVTSSSAIPGTQFFVQVLEPEGLPADSPGKDFKLLYVDHDFVRTYGIDIVEGRDFLRDFGTDSTAMLVNEAAVRAMGWDEPIGKRIRDRDVAWDRSYTVVGVTDDFNYESLHTDVQPLVIRILRYERYLTLKLAADDLAATLPRIEQAWQSVVPGMPMEHFFLDDSFEQLYRFEQTLRQTFRAFAFLTILVACLGLFGLAAFLVQQRRREIGIRKVLGASAGRIVTLFARDFLQLVLLGFVLAVPLGYFAMAYWLHDFAYRISIGAGPFVVAGGLALLIALGTISYQTLRAALADPVESLRHE